MPDKLPYIQIFVGDFYVSKVSSLDHNVQCLWFRLLLQMHVSDRRGYLEENRLPIPAEIAARKAGFDLPLYNALLPHLVPSVFGVTPEGVIYDKTMVDLERKRKALKDRVKSFRRGKSVTHLKRDCNASVTSIEYENENEYVNDVVKEAVNATKIPEKFKPPTPQQVEEYALSVDYKLDGNRFCDYYSANGWMRGKNKIKDWKACVRTWKQNDKSNQIDNVDRTKEREEKLKQVRISAGLSLCHGAKIEDFDGIKRCLECNCEI